jgi:hypothetical protein
MSIMNYITNSFLDDDELFSLFAIDDNPPLQRSKSFRLNVSNGLVELLGIKGNMLAFRKLTQGKDRVLVKVGIDPTIDIEGRLQKIEFAPCPRSTREGFNEFQRVVRAPNGYTQQCDPIPTIWRSWWPIAKQTLNGRAVVLVFHEGNWLDVHKIETGVNPTIFTKLPEVEISASTAIPWAIDTRHLKVQKVQVAAANQSPLNCADERSWLHETAASKGETTMSQTLTEIRTIGDRWLATINSLQDNRNGLLTETKAIEQHKSQLVKTLEYLVVLSKEQS